MSATETKIKNLPETMKAWRYESTGPVEQVLQFAHGLPNPAKNRLLDNDIIVKIKAVSINPLDFKTMESSVMGLMKSKPSIPSCDFAGEVIATGTKVDSLKIGSIVFGTLPPSQQSGALAEYTVTQSTQVAPVPSGVDLNEAACIGVAGATAYQCIQPFVKAGDHVFINGGSGGTGTFGIQFAKALGCKVTVSCSGANAELCKSLGADDVIDYKSTDLLQALAAKGQIFALAVDNVGSPENLYRESDKYLIPSGRFVQIAGSPTITSVKEIASRFVVPGFLGGGKRKFSFIGNNPNDDMLRTIAKMMAEGKVKAVIDSKYKFEQANLAFAKLKEGRSKGNIVIEIS